MSTTHYRIVSLGLAVVFILAACAPAPAPATPDQAQIQSQISTAVAGTVAAQQSATAAAQPPASSTPETLPATVTPVLPTATPFVIATSTSFSAPGNGSGSGSTKPKYACDVIRQRPFDNSIFHGGDPFDIKWTIVNTGTATWPAGTDFTYFSGPKMTTATFLELPEMKSGDQYAVRFDANAPTQKGFNVMTWKVQGGFCYPYVAIIVK
jgi:hypothetical protein